MAMKPPEPARRRRSAPQTYRHRDGTTASRGRPVALQALRNLAQQIVADVVAQHVVHLFETIEIKQQQG
jgi:hypothetical protein